MRGIKKNEAAQQKGGGGRERTSRLRHLCSFGSRPCLRVRWSLGTEKCFGRPVVSVFFAFLPVGEMTAPSDKGFDPAVHLGIGDVAVDDPWVPSVVRIRIKQSKTDPFRKGIDLFVGKTASAVYPVAALLDYLQERGMGPGPLFRYRDGCVLTRPRFAAVVRSALKKAGMDQSKYCTHSFRIGAATTAAARGIEDSVLKTIGRWESLAYLQYIRIPRERLTGWGGSSVGSQTGIMGIITMLS